MLIERNGHFVSLRPRPSSSPETNILRRHETSSNPISRNLVKVSGHWGYCWRISVLPLHAVAHFLKPFATKSLLRCHSLKSSPFFRLRPFGIGYKLHASNSAHTYSPRRRCALPFCPLLITGCSCLSLEENVRTETSRSNHAAEKNEMGLH